MHSRFKTFASDRQNNAYCFRCFGRAVGLHTIAADEVPKDPCDPWNFLETIKNGVYQKPRRKCAKIGSQIRLGSQISASSHHETPVASILVQTHFWAGLCISGRPPGLRTGFIDQPHVRPFMGSSPAACAHDARMLCVRTHALPTFEELSMGRHAELCLPCGRICPKFDQGWPRCIGPMSAQSSSTLAPFGRMLSNGPTCGHAARPMLRLTRAVGTPMRATAAAMRNERATMAPRPAWVAAPSASVSARSLAGGNDVVPHLPRSSRLATGRPALLRRDGKRPEAQPPDPHATASET